MIRILGSEVTVIKCASSPLVVGLEGVVALESMRMLTIVSPSSRKVTIPKKGTALQLKGTKELVIADDMTGRLEERIAKGAKL
jgi:RNase P/RNase MRP subunit p29